MEFEAIKVNKDNVYRAILTVVNFQLNLTDFEMEMLLTLLKHKLYVVDSIAREVIRKSLDKGKYTTNNYINNLKKKGVLIQASDSRKLYINPSLRNLLNSRSLTFKFDATEDIPSI